MGRSLAEQTFRQEWRIEAAANGDLIDLSILTAFDQHDSPKGQSSNTPILHFSITPASLFLNQHSLKNRPLIQIRPDRGARGTMVLHFPPRLATEAVNQFRLPPASAKPTARLAVFDLVAGNAGFEIEGDTRNLTPLKRDYLKKAVGLIGREEGQSGSRG